MSDYICAGCAGLPGIEGDRRYPEHLSVRFGDRSGVTLSAVLVDGEDVTTDVVECDAREGWADVIVRIDGQRTWCRRCREHGATRRVFGTVTLVPLADS